eukprot:1353200-Pyramimonas_sp.AAC.1
MTALQLPRVDDAHSPGPVLREETARGAHRQKVDPERLLAYQRAAGQGCPAKLPLRDGVGDRLIRRDPDLRAVRSGAHRSGG